MGRAVYIPSLLHLPAIIDNTSLGDLEPSSQLDQETIDMIFIAAWSLGGGIFSGFCFARQTSCAQDPAIRRTARIAKRIVQEAENHSTVNTTIKKRARLAAAERHYGPSAKPLTPVDAKNL